MEFRPIATAPKDGNFIYLIGDSGYLTFPFRIKVGRWVKGFRDFWIDHANDSFEDDGGPPQFWAPIPVAHTLRYNTMMAEIEEKQKALDTVRKERPESCDTEEEVIEWIFTFCADHAHPNGFCAIKGSFMSARMEMIEVFGSKWGFQYRSREDAGVDKYGLIEIP